MSLFSGNITLTNLEVRPTAVHYFLEHLHGPLGTLEAIRGTVSELQLSVSRKDFMILLKTRGLFFSLVFFNSRLLL